MAKKVYTIVRTTTKNELLSVEDQYRNIDAVISKYNLVDVKSVEWIGVKGDDVHNTRDFLEIMELIKDGEISGVVASSIDRLIKVTNLNRDTVMKNWMNTDLTVFTPDRVIHLNDMSDIFYGIEN